ncbi:MAG: amino acid ABC transporter permease [Xanthomonadaceae bacterium]|nr:amino acid ABC transporter permease [Xanthomonadaceae bacterium]
MKQAPSTFPRRPPWWRRPQVQAWLLQALLLAAVLGAIVWMFGNALDNLARQGIASGFGFWNERAGFAIATSLIEYSETSTYGRAFLVGLLNTLLVSALGVVFATVLGFLIGIARLSPNWLIRQWAAAYIELVRNVPLLLQIFFWYFAVLRPLPQPRHSIELLGLAYLNNRGLYLPKPILEPGFGWLSAALLLGLVGCLLWLRRARREAGSDRGLRYWLIAGLLLLAPAAAVSLAVGLPLGWELPEFRRFNFRGGLVLSPEFVALLTALSTYTAAFIAEIVRAGIQSVSQGQREAAYSLGLSPGQTLRHVVLPQAMRVIVPPLTNQYLNLTKNSSLAAAIAYPDLVSVFAGTVLNQTGQAVEVIGVTMAVYLTISLVIAALMNWYNRRVALVER